MNRLENFQQKYDRGGIKTMDKKKKLWVTYYLKISEPIRPQTIPILPNPKL